MHSIHGGNNLDWTRALNLFITTLKYFLIAYIGGLIGTIIALSIVICFALIIVNGYCNIYYASIFLFIGWGYAWKLVKKN